MTILDNRDGLMMLAGIGVWLASYGLIELLFFVIRKLRQRRRDRRNEQAARRIRRMQRHADNQRKAEYENELRRYGL
ncbi:MAG: hypothetical protein IJ168_07970 [Eubacterium sp.]|nr:hypothetical protein [Eubacterium sp.]